MPMRPTTFSWELQADRRKTPMPWSSEHALASVMLTPLVQRRRARSMEAGPWDHDLHLFRGSHTIVARRRCFSASFRISKKDSEKDITAKIEGNSLKDSTNLVENTKSIEDTDNLQENKVKEAHFYSCFYTYRLLHRVSQQEVRT